MKAHMVSPISLTLDDSVINLNGYRLSDRYLLFWKVDK